MDLSKEGEWAGFYSSLYLYSSVLLSSQTPFLWEEGAHLFFFPPKENFSAGIWKF